MKIDAIDVSAYPDNNGRRIPGWGVSVSQKAWGRCVAVPDGRDGISEEERVGDLLAAMWAAVRRQAREEPEWIGFVPFAAEVRRIEAGGSLLARAFWRGRPAVELHAVALCGPDGRPYLLVAVPDEGPCCSG